MSVPGASIPFPLSPCHSEKWPARNSAAESGGGGGRDREKEGLLRQAVSRLLLFVFCFPLFPLLPPSFKSAAGFSLGEGRDGGRGPPSKKCGLECQPTRSSTRAAAAAAAASGARQTKSNKKERTLARFPTSICKTFSNEVEEKKRPLLSLPAPAWTATAPPRRSRSRP